MRVRPTESFGVRRDLNISFQVFTFLDEYTFVYFYPVGLIKNPLFKPVPTVADLRFWINSLWQFMTLSPTSTKLLFADQH